MTGKLWVKGGLDVCLDVAREKDEDLVPELNLLKECLVHLL